MILKCRGEVDRASLTVHAEVRHLIAYALLFLAVFADEPERPVKVGHINAVHFVGGNDRGRLYARGDELLVAVLFNVVKIINAAARAAAPGGGVDVVERLTVGGYRRAAVGGGYHRDLKSLVEVVEPAVRDISAAADAAACINVGTAAESGEFLAARGAAAGNDDAVYLTRRYAPAFASLAADIGRAVVGKHYLGTVGVEDQGFAEICRIEREVTHLVSVRDRELEVVFGGEREAVPDKVNVLSVVRERDGV